MSAAKLLANKTAVLTGASRGIGRELACRLSKEGGLSKLILCAHPWHKADLDSVVKEVKGCSECGDVEGHVLDMGNFKEVDRFAQECAKKNPDILINNAGIFGGRESKNQGPLEGSPDDWEATMRVNALAPFRLIRALCPGMAKKGEGYIINIGDVEAHHEGPHHPAYSASKAALTSFTRSSYEVLRGHGVKVVDIAPGCVHDTGMEKKSDMFGGQGAIEPSDVAEAVMFVFQMSKNAVPEEIVIKALKPGA